MHGDGPLLILAGAGSGKTSVMTHRIARLILDEGVKPRNILAVTFTNKAAGEMRERVAKLIYGAEAMEAEGEALIREMSGYGGLWILTFHSACLRILHGYAERLGYTNNFAVYDPADQKAAIKRCVEELNLDPKQFSASYALAAISGLKEDGKTPEDVLTETENQYIGPRRRDLARLYQNYIQMLTRNNAMDFDDLLVNAVRLFEGNRDVLEYYQNRFHYIMVDEYQDTNRMQYLFVKMLAEKSGNLCVVGDDDQSIYGWRGADIRNILDFEKDFKRARVVKLEQNYRSYASILDCANSVIRGNKGRKPKALWTDRGAGEKVIYKQIYDEKEEARFIADEVRKLSGSGRNYRGMAILTRTNAQSRTFEEAFIAHGIAYRMLGQIRYYDRKEIKDMLSYMALCVNPKDDVALIRVINEPRRGIGDKSVAQLAAAASAKGVSMLELLSGEIDRGDKWGRYDSVTGNTHSPVWQGGEGSFGVRRSHYGLRGNSGSNESIGIIR
jgi:DNA helicase-2/ATP-dependent DNA helicase PcrA